MNRSSSLPGWTPLSPNSPSPGPSSAHPPPAPGANPNISATENGPPVRRRHGRRPQEVYDIINNFLLNINPRPSKQQREELAQRIRHIPGCEDYTDVNVYNYLKSKRRTSHEGLLDFAVAPAAVPVDLPSSAVTSAHILYPSLTKDPSTLRLVEILCNENPTPTEEIALLWAHSLGLGVTPEDILKYARYRELQRIQAAQHARASPSKATPPPPPPSLSTLPPQRIVPPLPRRNIIMPQLPTPSISPEPHSPMLQTGGSAVVLTKTPSVKEEDELESDDDIAMGVPSSDFLAWAQPDVSRFTHPRMVGAQPPQDQHQEQQVIKSRTPMPSEGTRYVVDNRLRNDLAASLREALSEAASELQANQYQPVRAGPSSATTPRSFAQFSEWMVKHNQTSVELLEGISRGQYASLGLNPISPPATN